LIKILIIDDNKDLLQALVDSLSAGFDCTTFTSAEKAIEHLRVHLCDAVVLDVHLPHKDGYEIFKEIRQLNPTLPILFLSGDGTLPSKLKGLDMGADDFLTKPVDPQELEARIKNRIHLAQKLTKVNKVIQLKDLVIDTDAHQVSVSGQSVKLTPKEYQLLLVLTQNPNRVIHKDDLITMLWKDVHVEVNNLDTHFSNLRRKTKPFSNHIKTLKNLGYVLRI
jgi:DNA-binding response OmpR family regulator